MDIALVPYTIIGLSLVGVVLMVLVLPFLPRD